ncbi:hypothetical protein PH7735_00006 [Shimia thalassica]|uniref:Uncharacterized protein n=1 Tax=Shimia thalassica TaxID=1715693 RepID=A0A0P1IKI7_9RHOB|nr:hypothetical protein [Shimia thalassica]CUJ81334.1 hypothetical protein PH7735_00006 [Shimia thalassica]
MQNPSRDWESVQLHFEEIATLLEVPQNKRNLFLQEVLEYSEVPSWLRDQDISYDVIRLHRPANALQKTAQRLGEVIEEFCQHRLTLHFLASPELSRTLALLLNQPDANALFPDLSFIIPNPSNVEYLPQLSNFEGLGAIDGSISKDISIKYAEDPDLALISLLRALHKPLEQSLEGDWHNKGGRRSDRIREYTLKTLLALHDKVFGSRATSTPTGKFCTMCHYLFESFGESTDGLDEAIKRFLLKQRAKSS